MAGLLETILTRRYGAPQAAVREGHRVRVWNAESPDDSSHLYWGMDWNSATLAKYEAYRELYGDAFGGLLVGDSLKVATLAGVRVYGTYVLEDLQDQPEIRLALGIEPGLSFFMDAANVWYYALKGTSLYAWDSEFDELDELGPVKPEIERLIAEWEETNSNPPEKV